MNRMKKISVIVPTYNVEAYIAKCLDSLLAQDYENYDVIVVNDGSPFNEQTIIDKYTANHPEIFKCIQKENGGYGSALEAGFNLSDADYILVCDPDDYLANNALSTLMKYQEETQADLVVGSKNLVYSDNEEIKYDPSFNPEFGILEDKKVYRKGNKDFNALYFMEPSPHAKLYPLALVKEIKFPHKVSYTDNLLFFYSLNKVETVTYCEEPLSFYLINRIGNTRTDLKPTIIDAWVTVFNTLLDQSKGEDIFYYRLFEAFYSIFYKIDNISGDNKLKEAKYELLYTYLKRLIPYKDAILKLNKIYVTDTSKVLAQKEALLDNGKSYKMYQKLYRRRLYGSLKDHLKDTINNSPLLTKLYEIYHFHAKYYYTRNDDKVILKDGVSANLIDPVGTNFFGYYDKPCIYKGHSLYLKTTSTSLSYKQNMGVYVDGNKIGDTEAFNFQQGSMESWMDENHIIYNFFDGKQYRSKIVTLRTKEERILCAPIYSLAKNNEFALTLNFSRLAKLRKDYGYFNLPYDELRGDDLDGIYYLDINKNEVSLYLSLDEIKAFMPKDIMVSATHKVNHIDISPDSKKAIFLHRYFYEGKKYTRLLMVNIETKELTLLADNEMVSHMCWVNNDLLFGYLRRKDNKDGYAFIDLKTLEEKPFDHPYLLDDGHPTAYSDRYIVTDRYPDYTCKSKLFLIDTLKNDVTLIGQFYSGKKYQDDKRCDLHPRFDHEGKSLTIDTVAYEDRKKVLHIDLSSLIKEEK